MATALFAARVAHCNIAVPSMSPSPYLQMTRTGLRHIKHAFCGVTLPTDSKRTFRGSVILSSTIESHSSADGADFRRQQPSFTDTNASLIGSLLPAIDQYRQTVRNGSFSSKSLPAFQPMAALCLVIATRKQSAPAGFHCVTQLGLIQCGGVHGNAGSPSVTRASSSKAADASTIEIAAPLDEAVPSTDSKPLQLSALCASDQFTKRVAATDSKKSEDVRDAKQQHHADDSYSGELRLVSTRMAWT